MKLPIILLLFFQPILSAQPAEISTHNNIKFEYYRLNEFEKTPLVICVPGFTQHNRSPEFQLLKQRFRRLGFSWLIMNPPQHGEDIQWFKKMYSWGDGETDDLLALVDTLRIGERHSEIHMLGFSIGAKVVLKFASSKSALRDSITSVIAVTAPYRVGDINLRLSGDYRKLLEGVASSLAAHGRSSFLKLSYMMLFGMSKSLLNNRASPASAIGDIRCPVLLLHGTDDWLTKSYHSRKLFNIANPHSRFALVFLDTPAHAEDMLSRGGADIKKAFFESIEYWFQFVRNGDYQSNKRAFDSRFKALLSSRLTEKSIFPARKISLMSSTTFLDLNSNLWNTPADYNHSLVTVNALHLNAQNSNRYFITAGSTKLRQGPLDRFRVGLSFEQKNFNRPLAFESYVSFYNPMGSLLWLRRISYISGIGSPFDRRILSADMAFAVLDFQINYGTFSPDSYEWLLAVNFPLIGNGAATYSLGIGYSRFLSRPAYAATDNFSVYLNFGPRLKLNNSRLQASLQYNSKMTHHEKRSSVFSFGIMANFQER